VWTESGGEAIARVPLRASARRPSLAAEWRDNSIPSHGNVRRIDKARVRLRRVLKLAERYRHQSENADPSPDDAALTHARGLLFVHELKRRSAPAESLEQKGETLFLRRLDNRAVART
jgi:hypothetical protein